MIGDRKRSLGLRKATWGGTFQLADLIFLAVLVFLLSGCGGGGTGGENPQNSNFFVGSGKALLSWEAPADANTSATTIAGYKVYIAAMSPIDKGNSFAIDVGNATTYSVEGLGAGTYYFAVTAYNSAGDESLFSNEVSKTF